MAVDPLAQQYLQDLVGAGIEYPQNFVFQLLAAGPATDMSVDGDASPTVFKYTVPAGVELRLRRVNISITDANIRPSRFGGIAGGIANGLLIQAVDVNDVQIIDFGLAPKTNSELGLLAGTDVTTTAAAADDGLIVRWTLMRAGADLRLTAGQEFRITVRDDLTDLDTMFAMVQGTLVPA